MAGYADEATVQVGADGRKLNGGWWPVPWKDGKYINASANCYVCISSSIKTPNPKTGKMRYWRGESSFGHGLALMVDDIGHGKGSKGGLSVEWFGSRLPPTAVVETSPGNFQLWYFLDQPCDDMRLFKGFLSSFVGSVLKKGGDATIKDVSRYGRMPVGINNKRVSPDGPFKYADAARDGAPFEVELRWFDASVRYSMDTIARAFAFEIVVPAARARPVIDPDELRMDQLWLVMAERVLSEAKAGEGSGGVVQMNMSGKYRIACPWGAEHTNGDPFGAYFRGPIPGADVDFVFGCGHDTCRRENRRTWATFVDFVVMPLIEAELEEANRNAVVASDRTGDQ
ncbi:hypothetical protein PLUTO_00620 [Luteibacter phage vB_LflM-Pluto]|uniref:RepB-like DNA primase domain-containing protein n=1 Tax=Luteibacter phage vB_LflM-Pluto TaxID=2948611 RepID=A0A9E7MTS9_9CAUD|nr:hypothetical protein PLUTO_00620 [Luteibacter phage vB_LflM-Pluto]